MDILNILKSADTLPSTSGHTVEYDRDSDRYYLRNKQTGQRTGHAFERSFQATDYAILTLGDKPE